MTIAKFSRFILLWLLWQNFVGLCLMVIGFILLKYELINYSTTEGKNGYGLTEISFWFCIEISFCVISCFISNLITLSKHVQCLLLLMIDVVCCLSFVTSFRYMLKLYRVASLHELIFEPFTIFRCPLFLHCWDSIIHCKFEDYPLWISPLPLCLVMGYDAWTVWPSIPLLCFF